MSYFSVRGRTAATTAAAGLAVAALWNPHATSRISVVEFGLCCTVAPAAGASILLQRLSARGTPGSTITPAIQQGFQRDCTPQSGALLDLAIWTGVPTIEAAGFMGWVFAAVAASGIIYPIPRGIELPPGTGLCIVTAAAILIPASEVWFQWEE